MTSDPSLLERLTDLAGQIQQIPAATFNESRRSQFILDTWIQLGVNDAWLDAVGNVFARLPGTQDAGSIVVSAHLDTVFPLNTELPLRVENERTFGPGIGDNSIGLASLFAIYWSLSAGGIKRKKNPILKHDLWLVANVCEEGLGDLKGMKAVVDHFGSDPLAYLVLEGMSLGQVYHRGLGVRRYRISVRTRGGHSWIDYGSPSAIHQLAELIVKIKDIPLPTEPRTTINFGTISGGTSVNTIAAEASCELDLRSESLQALEVLVEQVITLIEAAGQKWGEFVHVSAEVIGDRPTGEIPANHPLVKLALDCHARNGIKPRLIVGSTDANVPLSRGLPAICVGLTTGGGAHTLNEYIDLPPLRQGLDTVLDIIRGIDRFQTTTGLRLPR